MTTDLTHRLIVGVPQEAVRPGWTGTRGGLQILDEVISPILGLRDFRDSAQIMTADLFQNSFGHYPNLALIQGRDDKDSVIQPGSYHYLYLADSQSSTALSIHFSTHGYLVRLTFNSPSRIRAVPRRERLERLQRYPTDRGKRLGASGIPSPRVSASVALGSCQLR